MVALLAELGEVVVQRGGAEPTPSAILVEVFIECSGRLPVLGELSWSC
jgi:hypothetical protein